MSYPQGTLAAQELACSRGSGRQNQNRPEHRTTAGADKPADPLAAICNNTGNLREPDHRVALPGKLSVKF